MSDKRGKLNRLGLALLARTLRRHRALGQAASLHLQSGHAERPHFLVPLAIALNWAITLPLAAVLNIEMTEAYSLNTSGQGLGYAVVQAMRFEEEAPLYFVILNLWRGLDHSIFFARLFSILCIALTIWVAAQISEALFPEVHPAWLAVAIALNPLVIWAALEIRLCAFSLLLSALLLFLFLAGYWDASPQRIVRGLYGLVATLALYTSYVLGFLLVVQGVVLLCLGQGRAFWRYCRDLIMVGLLCLPLLWFSLQQWIGLTDRVAVSLSQTPWFNRAGLTFGSLLFYLLPAPIGQATPDLWLVVRAVLLGGVVLIAIRFYYRIESRHFLPWLLTCLMASLCLLTWQWGEPTPANPTQILFLPVLLSAIAAFALIQREPIRNKVLAIWLAVTLLLNAIALYDMYRPLAKNGDYMRVAAYLMTHEQPNQPILVFNPEVENALAYYYQGVNTLVPLPQPEDFYFYDQDSFLLEEKQTILGALSPTAEQPEWVWLVADTGILPPQPLYQRSYQILEDFTQEDYSVEQTRNFYGSQVRLLHRSSRESE